MADSANDSNGAYAYRVRGTSLSGERALAYAALECRARGRTVVGKGDLLVGLLRDDGPQRALFARLGVGEEALHHYDEERVAPQGNVRKWAAAQLGDAEMDYEAFVAVREADAIAVEVFGDIALDAQHLTLGLLRRHRGFVERFLGLEIPEARVEAIIAGFEAEHADDDR